MSALPLTTLKGFIKQVRTKNLDERTSSLLHEAFPGYLDASTYGALLEQGPVYRKFGGDESIKSDQYFTLCEANGFDGGTLVWEIMSRWSCSTLILPSLIDSTVHTGEANRIRQTEAFLRDRHFLLFVSAPIKSVRLLPDLNASSGYRPDIETLDAITVSMPLLVDRIEVDNVIDLRLRITQKWFASHFSKLESSSWKVSEERNDAAHTTQTAIDFLNLLPTLLAPGLDGSSFIQSIGIWLRSNGVNGLVYPSAFRNFRVWSGNDKASSEYNGWCFVDYQNSDKCSKLPAFGLFGRWMSFSESNLQIDREITKGEECWVLTGAEEHERIRYEREIVGLAKYSQIDEKRISSTVRTERYCRPNFVPFSGNTIQIDAARLTPLQQLAIRFGFPLFLGRPENMVEKPGAAEEIEKLKRIPRPLQELHGINSLIEEAERKQTLLKFVRRRYSGDTTTAFPRSKYHSLYWEGIGNDNLIKETLIGELNAYAKPLDTGFCVARSGSDVANIELVFRGFPGEPNPLHEFVSNPGRFSSAFEGLPINISSDIDPSLLALIPSSTEFVVPVSFSKELLQIRKCFDLRQPDAREWMVAFFADPPTSVSYHDLNHGAMLPLMARDHHFDLASITDWASLASITNAQTMGGNPFTDLIGTYLRKLGCEALIFPSARCDYYAHFSDQRLLDFSGWNLVDYRHSQLPKKISMDTGNPIEPLHPIINVVDVKSGTEAGSLILKGNGFYNRMVNQCLYDSYVQKHCVEWMSETGKELHVRGYLWYRKKYPVSTDQIELFCDSCEQLFSESKWLFTPSCPNCGYEGDV